MKKLFLTSLFVFIAFIAFSQLAESFDDAKTQGISPKVDSIYQSACHRDSTKAVFPHSGEFMVGYKDFLQKLASYLYKNGFKCGTTGMGYFNRIYFSPNGKIDYYLYKFMPGTIDSLREMEFKRLANEFIKEYQFPLTANKKFAQCSHVVLCDPADKK